MFTPRPRARMVSACLPLLILAACGTPDDTEPTGLGVAAGKTLTVAELVGGDLVVAEIMRDPVASPDTRGEWFELYNASGEEVDLDGLVIADESGEGFTVSGTVLVAAGDVAVLGLNGASGANGGYTPDYVYDAASFRLADGTDAIIVSNGRRLIDRVRYGGFLWPVGAGASLTLDVEDLSASRNDFPTNWCAASTPFGAGDFGTPGTPNEDCAEVPTDRDRDGYLSDVDCDDDDRAIHPGATERCDGLDSDCDGDDELLGYWTFDEGAGTTAGDSGPNGWDGTLVGSGWTTAGYVDGGLDQAGGARYVDLPAGAVEPTGGITITAWARPTQLRGYNAIVARGSLTAIYNPYHLGYKDGEPLWTTDNGSLGPALQDASDPSGHLDEWHHLVGTWDAASGERVLYVDGVAAVSDTLGPSTMTYEALPTRFGADTNAGSTTGYFVGTLDEIKILDCAIDAAGALADYTTGWPG